MSLRDVGRFVVVVGATIIGNIIAPGIGAAIGSMVGGVLAGALFPPPGVRGPRLQDLNVQRSTVGAPVPIVYGTFKLAGNIIWSGGLVETAHTSEHGRLFGISGTGQKQTTYTYAASFAVGLCEGEILGVRRVWADSDLIYDVSSDEAIRGRADLWGGVVPEPFDPVLAGIRAMSGQLAAGMVVYTGNDTQLPDPTIQSYENVGYVVNVVPAYRGLAYLVFTDFQLAKYGNRIPVIKVEVVTSGAATDCTEYSPGVLLPWNNGETRDPRVANGVYEYGGAPTWYDDLQFAVDDADPNLLLAPVGWALDTDAEMSFPPCVSVTTENVVVYLMLNYLSPGTIICDITAIDGDGSFICGSLENAAGDCNAIYWQGRYLGDVDASQFHGFWGIEKPGDCTEADLFGGYTQPGTGMCVSGRFVQYLTDTPIAIRRSLQPPDPCSQGTPLTGSPGFCVLDGVVTQGSNWIEVAGTFKVLQKYTTVGNVVTKYPVGPILKNDDPLYDDEAYWTAAYNAQLAEQGGSLPVQGVESGWVYGVDYPAIQFTAWYQTCGTIDVDCVPMSVIVQDICRRSGLRIDSDPQIDVSGLTTCVRGYGIGTVMSGRDALGPLRAFGLWDCVESDDGSGTGLLKFVERGHAIVATLTADDLGVHEHGSESPPTMEVTRIQEKDLPRRLRLHFANFLLDHEPSEQSASRQSTEAVSEIDVELPITMTPDEGAQLAEIFLYAEYAGRSTYRFSLDHDWLHLEPTDCVEIPVDGERTERVRITSIEYAIGGILNISAQRDDDGAYVSTAIATPESPSGAVPIGPGQGPVCPSGIVLLDIPRLSDAHVDAGYYAAVYGLCESWECADLYRSSDGGITYGRVAHFDDETTVGTITDISGPPTDPPLPGDSPPYDELNSITVSLYEGELASITDAQIEDGQNLAAIGIDGRWVVIQFKTVTVVSDTSSTVDTTSPGTGDTSITIAVSYVLTDLIWGLYETRPNLGTTIAGDTFVLLSDSGLLRVPDRAEAIGVEQQFKIVTCGEDIDEVEPFDFTTWGLSYLRTCPSTVLSATLTALPETGAQGDAYLLPNDTALEGVAIGHGGEVAYWSDETESWLFCTPLPGTVITITTGDTAATGEGGGEVISGGDGTYSPSPWTPAIPPLPDIGTSEDLTDTSCYAVVNIGGVYYRVACTDIAGGGFSVQFMDEGVALGTPATVTAVDFVGAGVTATYSSGVVTVTITATGSGGYPEHLGYSGII